MEAIGSYAFSDCTGLKEVVIPDGVTSIDGGAFSGCTGLTEIVIPDSIMSIDGGAFSGCTGLKEVVIPDGVTSIDGGAFSGCTGLTEMVIPDSVTSIGDWVFSGCTGLKEVVIPDSVTLIGYMGFYGCNLLSTIYYAGTEVQWHNIKIEEYNDALLSSTIHYSTDSIPPKHVWDDDYVIIKNATCTETGSKAMKCVDCGIVKEGSEVIIEAIGHKEEIDLSVDATCTKSGLTEGYHCYICKEIIVAQEEVQATGHSYGEWKIVKEPTTTETGEKQRTCTSCGYIEKEEIPVKEAEKPENPEQPDEPEVLLGDIDGSGEVDVFDAVMILEYCAGITDIDSDHLKVADADVSSEVDVFDAVAILEYCAGIITEFPSVA